MIFNTTSATNKSRIFLFIFFSRCGILALEKSTPVGGCPLQGSLCIYFFFLDFLDFLCFISWRAVKVKTKISIKSFIISKASCMVSITFFSFLRLALYSFLLFSFHGFIIYLFRYIVNAFFLEILKKIRGCAVLKRYTLNALMLSVCSSQGLSSLRRFSAFPSLPYCLFLP